jgi:plasmid stabilization system protein ParE
MKPVRLAPAARKEILDAAAWYDGERSGLGDAFVAAVDEALGHVGQLGPDCRPAVGVQPELGAKRVLVRRFPYFVVFMELPRSIRVLAVSHARRRPGYWKKRL